MKRSAINKALKELEAMCAREHCYLPPFCNFTPEEWQTKGHEYDEVRDCMLGWDITDYGLGDFEKVGFSLITLRNGNLAMADKYPKTYAEKLLFLKEGQYSPNHFHWHKMEDIINRGGGTLLIDEDCEIIGGKGATGAAISQFGGDLYVSIEGSIRGGEGGGNAHEHAQRSGKPLPRAHAHGDAAAGKRRADHVPHRKEARSGPDEHDRDAVDDGERPQRDEQDGHRHLQSRRKRAVPLTKKDGPIVRYCCPLTRRPRRRGSRGWRG